MMPFAQIFKSSPNKDFRGTLATFDPGETTGFSFWSINDEPKLIASKQLKTWPIEDAVHQFQDVLLAFKPAIVILESYRVYGWKTDEHSFSDIPTVQIIGCLKTICIQHNTPYHSQSAQIAKQFCTDDKLEVWGFWKKGERHSRDAIRHGAYFILFGKKQAAQKI